MPKFIQTKESEDYKKRLKNFMQSCNPKPDLATIEKLKQELIAKRGVK